MHARAATSGPPATPVACQTRSQYPVITRTLQHPQVTTPVAFKCMPNVQPSRLRIILNEPCAHPQPTPNVRRVQNAPDQCSQTTTRSFLFSSSLALPHSRAASEGPVIIVSASKYSCDAFIVFRVPFIFRCRSHRKMFETCERSSIP